MKDIALAIVVVGLAAIGMIGMSYDIPNAGWLIFAAVMLA